MLRNAQYNKKIEFTTVLMDSWYATISIILKIEDIGKYYYCPLKNNRLVDDSNGMISYSRVNSLDWNSNDISKGKIIKIHKFPKNHKVKLFRVAVSTNRTDYVITNDMDQDSLDVVQQEYGRGQYGTNQTWPHRHRSYSFYWGWTNGQVERMNRTLKEATVHNLHMIVITS